MNREQMIAKAATAIAWEPSVHYPDALQLRMHVDEDLASEIAAEILDALLPQVNTAEELEALPWNAVLATDDGHTYRAESPLIPYALQRGPLTVVWSPS